MSDLLRDLNSLALFRGVSHTEPLNSLRDFLNKTESDCTSDEKIEAYAAFVSVLYSIRPDADFSAAIWDALLSDMNPYLKSRIDMLVNPEEAEPINSLMLLTAQNELDILTKIGSVTSKDFKEALAIDGYLPDFTSSRIDFKTRYMRVIDDLPTAGYGIYAKYLMFKIDRGEIKPVKHPDPIRTEELFCYERQREKVVSNTQAFLMGKRAADTLLYGDAGTGKSSTVKAVARMFEKDGLRLVELPKTEIMNLPDVIEMLSQIPMKFILFIDDVSFESNDDRIGPLKSILEGAASGGRKNIVIYATSNRRHLIKESFADRSDEVHKTDTMAEQMSLSERFGLRVLFDKPNKMDFLTIVHKLCELRGISIPEEELDMKAEQFAIRGGGRSARLARQFVDLIGG
ncbi:MAG: ATP-binding protein [Saccharofermentans sp.]|nr:ATP-binding protein [Saccharofermentans sp.]